jgi:hypothetical protein
MWVSIHQRQGPFEDFLRPPGLFWLFRAPCPADSSALIPLRGAANFPVRLGVFAVIKNYFPVMNFREFLSNSLNLMADSRAGFRRKGPFSTRFPVLFPVSRELHRPGERFRRTASATRKSAQSERRRRRLSQQWRLSRHPLAGRDCGRGHWRREPVRRTWSRDGRASWRGPGRKRRERPRSSRPLRQLQSIATGLVLLSAVCLDMVLRRGRGYSSGGDFTPTPIPSKSGQGELEDRAAGRVGASP